MIKIKIERIIFEKDKKLIRGQVPDLNSKYDSHFCENREKHGDTMHEIFLSLFNMCNDP